MAKKNNVQVTSFDHQELKQSLIDFLETTAEFGDFNYEGSAINTMVDLLTRNSTYMGFLANMLANESFIPSAKIRNNVVSHAEKLSYVPRSATAAKLTCDITVTPASPSGLASSIIMPAGTTFFATLNNQTYTFTTNDDYTLTLDLGTNTYTASDVTLYQGQRVTNTFTHTAEEKVVIPNNRADTSTFLVTVAPSDAVNEKVTFTKATSLSDLSSTADVYFLGENYEGKPYIEFGRDIFGDEPATGSIVEITYINTELAHGNGVASLTPASVISGYSNISVSVTQAAYGGAEREGIEEIRFTAPKFYQAQGRALHEKDYIPFIKQNFPFVKSVSTWGGEKNDPPLYGSVVISLLPEANSVVTQSVKDDIVAFLDEYNVGSITPVIVDPSVFTLNLTIKFDFDPRVTSKTFNQLSTELVTIATSYDDEDLGDFLNVYNDSKLVDQLMDVSGVTTIIVDKKAQREIDVLRFLDPVYEIEFNNELVPGTVLMENFEVDASGSNHKLTDDSEGNIVLSYLVNGVTTTSNVGTIDYDTGVVQFSINMIQDANQVYFTVEPAEDNFFVENNSVVQIGTVTTQLVEKRIQNT